MTGIRCYDMFCLWLQAFLKNSEKIPTVPKMLDATFRAVRLVALDITGVGCLLSKLHETSDCRSITDSDKAMAIWFFWSHGKSAKLAFCSTSFWLFSFHDSKKKNKTIWAQERFHQRFRLLDDRDSTGQRLAELVNIGQLSKSLGGTTWITFDWSPHSFIQTHGRINETQGWSPREDPSRWWSKLFSTLIQVPLSHCFGWKQECET